MTGIEWRTIVEPMPRLDAEKALQCWLIDEAQQGRTYSSDTIREDVILSEGRKTLVQFSIPTRLSAGH